MKKLTRLIGGAYAGATYLIEDKTPTFKLPIKVDFTHFRPGDILPGKEIEIEVYAVTRTNGHFNYGVLNSLEFSDALDLMWEPYKRRVQI